MNRDDRNLPAKTSERSDAAFPVTKVAPPSPLDVHNRQGLSKYLSQSLSSDYYVFEDPDVRQTSTFIKSYLVEVHGEHDGTALEAWRAVFADVQRTDDSTLLSAVDGFDVTYFIDVSDPRFTLLHTIGRTKDTDQTLKALADGSTPGFDRAWFPSQFLLESRMGALRGFKFSHEPVASGVTLNSSQSVTDVSPVLLSDTYESLEVEGTGPEIIRVAEARAASGPRSSMWVKDSHTALDDYHRIRRSNVFSNRQALDSIQYTAATAKGRTINHGLYSNGKVVASGTSMGLHMLAVGNLKSKYGSVIRGIEDEYAIGWTGGRSGRSFSGEPLLFTFSADTVIVDLDSFAKSIFRASRPFRLFGFPHRRTERRLDIEAIDLHTGDQFSVELTREWMRLYLPKGSCGNVVARLYTNLLHSLDSDTTLTDGSGEMIFTGRTADEF